MLGQRKAGVILGYTNIAIKNLVNLIYTPMLLSFVGQEEYGVYQSSYSFVFSLTALSLGFSQAYVRFYSQRRARGSDEEIRRLNGVYLVMYVVVSLLAFALGSVLSFNAGTLFSTGFSESQKALAASVMTIMSATIALTLFNTVFDAYIIAREEFRFQQLWQMITVLATPFLAFFFLLKGFGVVGVAIANMAVTALLLLVNGVFCIREKGMRFRIRHFDFSLFREIAVFSIWIFANEVCNIVNQNVPNMLLGALSSASAVAIFAISVQIRSVFGSLSMALSNVFRPEINRIVAEGDDNRRLTEIMTRVGRYQLMVVCWVLGGFTLLGLFFIEHWAGAGFSDAYWLILLMVLANLVPLVQTAGIEIQRAKNLHKTRSVAMLISALGNVVLTMCLARSIGYWAPAVGYAASVALCNGVFMNWYYQYRVGLDMTLYWKRCAPVLAVGVVATAFCLGGSALLPVVSWTSFLVWGLAYSLLFSAMMWRFVLDESERKILTSIIPNR